MSRNWLQEYVDFRNSRSDSPGKIEISNNKLVVTPRYRKTNYKVNIPIIGIDAVNEALEHYFAAINSHPKLRCCRRDVKHGDDYFIEMLWKNMTEGDFGENAADYIRRRTEMILDTTFEEYKQPHRRRHFTETVLSEDGKPEKVTFNIFAKRTESEYGYETPYHMEFFVADSERVFELPFVRFGICTDSNGTKQAVIYCVQNQPTNRETLSDFGIDSKQVTNLSGNVITAIPQILKQMNAHNKIFRDSTPSMILSLALMIKMLAKEGITQVKIPDFVPRRYGAFENLRTKGREQQKEIDRIQHNASIKFFGNFMRLEGNVSGFKFLEYPDNVGGSYAVFSLTEPFECINKQLANLANIPYVNAPTKLAKPTTPPYWRISLKEKLANLKNAPRGNHSIPTEKNDIHQNSRGR